MSHVERIAAAAATRVASWAQADAGELQALLRDLDVRLLASGGAIASINGVDRWCPSWRDAVDEIAAHES
jgi:hypothetical protein